MMKILDLKKIKKASQSKNPITPEIQARLDAFQAVTGLFSKERTAEWLEHAKKVRSEWDRGY